MALTYPEYFRLDALVRIDLRHHAVDHAVAVVATEHNIPIVENPPLAARSMQPSRLIRRSSRSTIGRSWK